LFVHRRCDARDAGQHRREHHGGDCFAVHPVFGQSVWPRRTRWQIYLARGVSVGQAFPLGDAHQLESVTGNVKRLACAAHACAIRKVISFHSEQTVGNAIIGKHCLAAPNIKTEMNIGVTYDTPTEKMRRALKIIERDLPE